ncbi:Ugo1 protein [Pichia kluyveri]|uniref:Ugo1 protein n=1 Tax=Pichia kluyveri TaxID=36015 RepID=A0AAV5QZ42_PICKL|nr:Ugo1 protein [Pichia kluyveri]
MNTQDYLDGSLRPYVSRSEFDLHYPIAYQPQIGIIDTSTSQTISQSLPFVQSQLNGNRSIGSGSTSGTGIGLHGFGSRIAASAKSPLTSKDLSSYGKSVGDLEWNELFDLNNLKTILITLTTRFIQGWFRCIFSQPFDVICVLLQVGSFKNKKKGLTIKSNKNEIIDYDNTSDSDSEIEGGRNAYFDNNLSNGEDVLTDNEQSNDSNEYNDINNNNHNEIENLRNSRIERRKSSNVLRKKSSRDNNNDSKLINILIEPESLNAFDMINALLTKEGPRGILKAVNTTFLMNTLQYTIESWITGFISGIIGIPDPLFVELIHSPNANWSLILSIFSNVFANLIMSQIRLIRMKFIITTSSRGCRSFREIIWNIPRLHIFHVPKTLFIPSIITNFIKSFTIHYPDYLLNSMRINKYNNPYFYNMATVIMRIIGMFIRLPFETLFSRAQVNYLLTNRDELPEIMRVNKDDMCIEFGGYYGYLSTLYYILVGSKPLTYEGQSLEVDVCESEENIGLKAIFRGWKIGLVRLLSSYTLSLLRDDRYNNYEEKF